VETQHWPVKSRSFATLQLSLRKLSFHIATGFQYQQFDAFRRQLMAKLDIENLFIRVWRKPQSVIVIPLKLNNKRCFSLSRQTVQQPL
jgi:hypothetical protein